VLNDVFAADLPGLVGLPVHSQRIVVNFENLHFTR